MKKQIIGYLIKLALLIGLCGCVTNRKTAVLEEGLGASWPFNEGQGAVVKNICDAGRPGQFEGFPKWAKIGNNSVIDFNGEDAWIDCGIVSNVNMKNALTVEVWVYPRFEPYGDRIIIGYGSDRAVKDGGFYLYEWTMGRSDAHQWYVTVEDQKGNERAIAVEQKIALDCWQHVVFVYDQGRMDLYVDGVLRASQQGQDVLQPPADRDANMMAGKNGELCFNGKMGAIRLYNRPLNKVEIQRHFTEEAGKFGHK